MDEIPSAVYAGGIFFSTSCAYDSYFAEGPWSQAKPARMFISEENWLPFIELGAG